MAPANQDAFHARVVGAANIIFCITYHYCKVAHVTGYPASARALFIIMSRHLSKNGFHGLGMRFMHADIFHGHYLIDQVLDIQSLHVFLKTVCRPRSTYAYHMAALPQSLKQFPDTIKHVDSPLFLVRVLIRPVIIYRFADVSAGDELLHAVGKDLPKRCFYLSDRQPAPEILLERGLPGFRYYVVRIDERPVKIKNYVFFHLLSCGLFTSRRLRRRRNRRPRSRLRRNRLLRSSCFRRHCCRRCSIRRNRRMTTG